MLFDSHAHLDSRKFDRDRDKILRDAKANGLSYIMNAGADLASSIRAVNLAEKYDMVYASVGVHPHDVKDMDEDTIEVLKALSAKKKVKAIGEIGLDFHYDRSPRDEQRKWFKRQIELAKEVNLPIIIHDREANGEVFEILMEHKVWDIGCVLHCYSGSAELAKEYVKKGIYISIAGPVTFGNARKTQEVVKAIPLEWLLIETDCPYLTPVPHRGKRNEPAYVRYVAEHIAEAKGLSYEHVAKTTTDNTKRLFRIGDA
ncbi:TatD family hydrolase [Serpentinicella alkaliphila]|uniref:TatD DNase family protein n=1 Tax=Serpentinicella alkaliphila TaxID=1734049 RepID=A0A4R2TKN6_9FIRM|nr:TatD family hydrolase [Serpentinicella alkaliphila]QUH25100.1 TatD family hydrolase [Serpentinicella alkaliphila]TCQ01745.1 TatD DNase family protein [Serpentinicella alkaliphila]